MVCSIKPKWWADYEYLAQIFQENDILQYLCDYADEKHFVVLEKTKDNDVVVLEIN